MPFVIGVELLEIGETVFPVSKRFLAVYTVERYMSALKVIDRANYLVYECVNGFHRYI